MDKKPRTSKKRHNSHLKLIDGGLRERDSSGGEFLMAEATNTRLMGVIGLHISYGFGDDILHQFFYFDTEEYGFDDYSGFAGTVSSSDVDQAQVEATKKNMFGALGGEWVSLTEAEALYLIGYYAAFNLENEVEFPDGYEEYLWLVEASRSMDGPDLTSLMEKICTRMKSPYELINYYLMRCCGRDLSALRYLCTEEGMNDVIEAPVPATLFKNDITAGDERSTYRCESLVECNDNFTLYITMISVKHCKIASARLISTLEISPWEASLILRQPEYIVYMRYDGDKEAFYEYMDEAIPSFTHSRHPQGDLYIIYQMDNNHVRAPNYRLDRDTLSVIMALDSGEFLVEGQDPANTSGIANFIISTMASSRKKEFQIIDSYQFSDPVLGLFMESGIESFQEFLELSREPSPEDN